MSQGISGSKTVFIAATDSSVRRARSSGAMPGAKNHCGSLGDAFSTATGSAAGACISVITSSGKETLRLLQSLDEFIDFFERIIHGEGGAACRGHAETRQQRLRAMGSCPHRDTLAIDDRRDIVRM